EVTHNHPEGIKGAECTAAVMFLSRMGKSKEEILKYVVATFGYDLSESLDQMRERHEHVESCQDSLPKALKSFFEGASYEDVVRNAVSLGGDTDTLGAIAGAMAEAFYGLPVGIIAKGITYLPEDMMDVIKRFDEAVGRVKEKGDEDVMNEGIKEAVRAIHETMSDQAFYDLMEVLVNRMLEDGEVVAPMVDVNNVMDTLDLDTLKKGETFSFDREVRLQLDLVMNNEGQKWVPLFTSEEERHRQPTANVALNVPIERILLNGLKGEDVEGVVINPFGESLMMPKDLLRIIMDEYERTKNKVSLH
ncbi:MAG: ADP-ribosylglycohydrolase family protein, partial [Erysipelotrichaceae bacterium]|nr:ADP-ribosylglycohydrolase family protein [Erysipelotrichaceae bacterium]